MKRAKKLLALSLALLLVLSACTSSNPQPSGSSGVGNGDGGGNGGGGEQNNVEAISHFYDWQVTPGEDMSSFVLLYSEQQALSRTLCNVYSPLLEVNNHGVLQPAVATEWGSDDDGETWTFKLRNDVTWVDDQFNHKADCTAHDWATSLEWVLNFHKNQGKNTAMPIQMIAGAKEYYDYTKELSEAEAFALKATDAAFTDVVGIEVPDDYTLIYHCTGKIPYFDTVTNCACLYPLCQAQIDEMGVAAVIAQQPTEMWYNGPYVIQNFVRGNSRDLVRNPSYWDKDCTLFDVVTIQVLENADRDDELFQTEEVDRAQLSEATLRIIGGDPNHEFASNLVHERESASHSTMFFNYAKNNLDGTPDDNWNNAIANEAFRQSIYYGSNVREWWAQSNYLDPDSCETFTFSTPGLVTFSSGKDYMNRVEELLDFDTSGHRYNAELAQKYKEQAMKELEGTVTFPVEMVYYVSASSQDQLDRANIFKDMIEELGTDYITFTIRNYVQSAFTEVMNPSLMSFYVAAWNPDYGDPENFLTTVLPGDQAAFGVDFEKIDKCTTSAVDVFAEFDALAKKGMAIYDDPDARYEALAQAEAFALNKALFVPLRSAQNLFLTKLNSYTRPYAAYGVQSDMYKNIESSVEPYTAEQYEQFKADYEAGKI